MIYVSSDLHGYPLSKFQELLEKAGFGEGDFLFILGDVIDRNGDGGIEMLQWLMMQPNVELLLGNHEAMMLDCSLLFEEITDGLLHQLTVEKIDALNHSQTLWMRNGGGVTYDSLLKLRKSDPYAIQDILDYLRDAPLYDVVSAGGKDFVLCHAGLGNFRPNKRLRDYTQRELVWTRPSITDRYFDDRITIFGHTPAIYMQNPNAEWANDDPMRPVYTDTWIDIDVGAAAGEPYGPMLLRLDDMKEFFSY